jgi:hypothetical protein
MMTMTRTGESTLAATTIGPTLLLAFELGERVWKLGFTTGLGQRPRIRQIPARAVGRVLEEIRRAKVRFHLPADAPVVSCYEAGQGLELPIDAEFLPRLEAARLWDGTPIPAGLKARLQRGWPQLAFLNRALADLDAERATMPRQYLVRAELFDVRQRPAILRPMPRCFGTIAAPAPLGA